MANKTNCTKNGVDYYRVTKVIGKKLNKDGLWIDDRKEFYGKSKKDAEQKLQDYLDAQKKQTDNTRFFGEVADYFVYNVFVNSNAAEGTKEKYLRVYESIFRDSEISGKLIKDISSKDFQDIYNNASCAVSTIRAAHNILRRIYKYIDIEGYGMDITANLVVPEPEEDITEDNDEIVIWSDEEISTIVNNLGDFRHRLTIMFGLYTGCRIGEVLGLTYQSIDLKKKTVKISKQMVLKTDPVTGKRRITPTKKLKTKNAYRTIPLTKKLNKNSPTSRSSELA